MKEKISQLLVDILSPVISPVMEFLGFNLASIDMVVKYIVVFLISMLPIIELRGAVPVGVGMFDLDIIPTYIVSIIGNMLPVPFILLFITKFCEFLKKVKYLSAIPLWLEKKVAKKQGQITKYENLGLFVFVAIPLPGTGAWTGALIAAFLGYKFKDAVISIFCGVLTAGVIMSAISYGLFDFILGLFK